MEQPIKHAPDPGDTTFTPKGYPSPWYPMATEEDVFSEVCFEADLEARKAALTRFVLANPSPANAKAPWMELVRLREGSEVHWGVMEGACAYINQRKDCSDFYLHGLLRLLIQFGDHPDVPMPVLAAVRRAVLDFKYWPDEPGQDSMCTWSENHHILFASAALLAGQLYPDGLFTNSGRRGDQMAGIALARVRRWLNLRLRSGFSEWLSNVYYDEDLVALLNLSDFAAEDDIRRSATELIRLMIADLARHSYRGVFASTHGRSYEQMKKDPRQEATSELSKLLFGRGVFTAHTGMSSVAMLLSPARHLSDELFELAQEEGPVEHRQRMGIRVSDGARWGIGYRDLEDGMTWLTLEAYAHPRTIGLMLRMLDAFGWWENGFFRPFRRYRALLRAFRRHPLLHMLVRTNEKDLCRNTREEVNIYTWKTPEGMLSSAQDYRPGYGGDQQSVWQATLAPLATCFVTHPGREEGPSPNYWTGNGSLPRVGQVEDTLICLFDISASPGMYLTNRLFFTHAWLPRDEFDESRMEGGWIFVRKGKGYLALTARNGLAWHGERRERGPICEVISQGRQNGWICQIGREAEDGSFADFCARQIAAHLEWKNGLGVSFDAPGVGRLDYAWKGPLLLNGKPFAQHDYPRIPVSRRPAGG